MKVVFSPRAQSRLREVSHKIAADNPQNAQRYMATLHRKIQLLAAQPRIGRRINQPGDPELRRLVHEPYLVLYRVLPDKVRIVSIRHCARMLPPRPEDW